MASNTWNSIEGFDLTAKTEAGFLRDTITEPTAIQLAAIPPVLAGKHVVIHSGTGTGKTLAYLLPLLQRLEQQPKARAVVLSPSPELAMQTLSVADQYKSDTLNTGALVSTASHKQQRSNVQKSTRLIVGTPGRVLEMYAARKLKGVTTLVLDEPDPILGGKDAKFLLEVISRPDPKTQIIIAGATLGPAAESLVESLRGEVVRTSASESPLHEQIEHHVVVVQGRDAKDVRVARFIEKNRCRGVVLFVNKTSLIGHLYRYLGEHGLKPVSLSPERPKHEHKKSLDAFKSGEARVLVTTDKSMRGLDVASAEWVLHYELPHSAQAYVHRAGRTGRAGNFGRSVVFCLPNERALLKKFARELEVEFFPFER